MKSIWCILLFRFCANDVLRLCLDSRTCNMQETHYILRWWEASPRMQIVFWSEPTVFCSSCTSYLHMLANKICPLHNVKYARKIGSRRSATHLHSDSYHIWMWQLVVWNGWQKFMFVYTNMLPNRKLQDTINTFQKLCRYAWRRHRWVEVATLSNRAET